MVQETENNLIRVDSHRTNDPYYVGYTMLTRCLETDDFSDGMSSALKIAQDYMHSDSIVILKKGESGYYSVYDRAQKQSRLKEKILERVVNLRGDYFGKNKFVDMNIDERFAKRITTMQVTDNEEDFIIAILNNKITSFADNMEFMGILKKTVKDLVTKYVKLEEMRRTSEIDGLTLLYNRMAYRKREEELDKDTERPVTLALIDLFRLKYTNDNVNHAAGDKYISMTADLLKKAFRKKEEPIPHDDVVYRVGGDEFILISETKTREEVEEILKEVGQQVELFEFSRYGETPTGINFGVIERENGEPLERLYVKADRKLSDAKAKEYSKRHMTRRK